MLFTSVQPQSVPRCPPHIKWNGPCCLYQDVPLSGLWPKSGEDNLFFSSSSVSPSFPPSHTNALCLNKQREAGLSCSIVLFGESRARGLRLWAGLKSEFDMAPGQLADLVSVPQSATWLIIMLPCFSPTQKANNVQPLTNSTLENGPGVWSSPTPSRQRRCSLNLQSLSSTIGRWALVRF